MTTDLKESLKGLSYAAGPWIEETKVKLGEGHYGSVYAVKIRGLQCAGKKFNARLLEKPADRGAAEGFTTGQAFLEQCLQLAKIRHPNIVQLLGVLFDADSSPTLVSEVLPLNLAKCLEEYQHMPTYAKNSILLDVANGLRYAHEAQGNRPMVHGRLCPEKVLLTISLQAKICGFVNPSGVTLPDSSYTAPETGDQEVPLTTSADVFSFGNLVLHVVTQQYPQPSAKERLDPADAGRTITCSEVERREQNLLELGESHTLLGLVKQCLENEPGNRPTMVRVLQEVEQHAVSAPPPYASVLQVMQEVEQAAVVKENLVSLTQTLEGKQTELDAKQLEVDGLMQELEIKEKSLQACKEELDSYKQTVHSKERRMQMHDQALRAKDSLIKAKAREIVAKNQQLAAKESQLAASSRRIATLEGRVTSGKGHNLRYPTTPQRRSPSRSPAITRSQQVSPTFKESPYKFSQSAEAEDLAMKAGEVLRRSTPGRRGKAVPVSDGFFFQNKFEPEKTGIYGQQRVDPKLASILAKRHQRYEVEPDTPKNLESSQNTSGTEFTSDSVQLRKQVENRQHRSASASGMTPELQKMMSKRRSQIDIEPANLPPAAPPPTATKPSPPTAPRPTRPEVSPNTETSAPAETKEQEKMTEQPPPRPPPPVETESTPPPPPPVETESSTPPPHSPPQTDGEEKSEPSATPPAADATEEVAETTTPCSQPAQEEQKEDEAEPPLVNGTQQEQETSRTEEDASPGEQETSCGQQQEGGTVNTTADETEV